MIKINTTGEFIYTPVKVATTSNKRVLLEVHKDIYRYSKNLQADARQLIEEKGLTEFVDWDKVEKIVLEQAGIPEDITL